MSARYLNRKISSSFLIALMFVISSLYASVLPLDADIALESTRMARQNVLVQSSAAMLAQANQLTNIALQIIG